jgi:hypothetical protein
MRRNLTWILGLTAAVVALHAARDLGLHLASA